MVNMWNTKGVGAVVAVILCLLILRTDSLIVFHEKLAGKVGAGNYSYYALSRDGDVTIFLHSIEGDGDLYISDQSMQPTYDIMNHKLQSVTCGLDRVDVPSSFTRPINIGVYGHPSHEVTHFVLEVLIDDSIANPMPSPQSARWKDDVAENHDSVANPMSSSQSARWKDDVAENQSPPLPRRKKENGEESSLICRILLAVLEIVIETFLG